LSRKRNRKGGGPSTTVTPSDPLPPISGPDMVPARIGSYGTPWHERRLWQITPVRDVVWGGLAIVLVVLAVWVGYELRAIFTPVLIALALAYLFDPIITACERRWAVPRPVTIAVILLVLAGSILGFGAWVGPRLAQQIKELSVAAPVYLNRLAERADLDLDHESLAPLKQLADQPGTFIAEKAAVLIAGTGRAVGFIGNIIGKTTLVILTVALVPIYFFFFAWHFGPMSEHLRQYIPRSRRERALHVIRRMDRIIATYFRARVVIALAMGVMFSIGWAWAGVPYWLLLGMGSGLLSLIPYASIVGWPMAVLLKWLAVTTGAEAAAFDLWAVVVWPSAVYLVVQAIESWLLTPLIQGRSLDLSVVTVLIVVFIGGAVGGLYGLLLCIPIAACIKVLLVELILPPLRAWAAHN